MAMPVLPLPMTVRYGALSLDWFGYATLRVGLATGDDEFVVYLDPGRYGVLTGDWEADSSAAAAAHPDGIDYDARDGDLVLVTHDHHYDSDAIRRVASDDATVVVYEGVDASRVDRSAGDEPAVEPVASLPGEVRRIGATTTLALGPVEVRTTVAHNDPDGPHLMADGSPYHPEGFGCGYVVDCDGVPVFWPGDTDVLDAHSNLDVEVFCPPIGGSFTMDRRGAARLADRLEPRLTLQVHYNTFAALEADSAAFAADVAKRGLPVVLDEE